MGLKNMDLLQIVKKLAPKGINPLEYEQSLTSNNRRGATTVINKQGTGIDLVYQEFCWHWPNRFESLDDFVEALSDRLARSKTIEDEFDPCDLGEAYEQKETLLMEAQTKKISRIGKAVLDGLVEKKTKGLTAHGVKEILKISLERGD